MPSLIKTGSAMPDNLSPRVPLDTDNVDPELARRVSVPAFVLSAAAARKQTAEDSARPKLSPCNEVAFFFNAYDGPDRDTREFGIRIQPAGSKRQFIHRQRCRRDRDPHPPRNLGLPCTHYSFWTSG